MTPQEEREIEEFADKLRHELYVKLREKYPEGFPHLTQLAVTEAVLKAIRTELETLKSKRELVLQQIAIDLSSSINRWWD
jgi:hypothetical protein